MVKKLLVLTSMLLIVFELKAQLPPPCPTNDYPAADLCDNICIYCNFNGYMGSTAGYSGQTPPGFCGTIENEQWFGFIAGAGGATFTATPTNCATGNGVQIALYTSCSSNPIGCNGGTAGGGATPVSITAALTPGVNYFLMIDGYAGDQCEFTISVAPPSAVQAPNVGNTGLLAGAINACPGAVLTYQIPPVSGAGVYVWNAPGDWLINGQSPPVSFPAPGGNVVQVTIGNTIGNNQQICVQPLNSCNEGAQVCKNVNVQNIAPTILPPAIICSEDVPYTLPWGDDVYNSGLYENTYTSYQGCDSVVKKQITVKAPILKFLAPQSVCAGSCVTICGEEYCESGNFAHTCESFQGCDSIVNFSVIVLDPIAEIIQNGILSCSNTSIQLTSEPSPGTKIWKNLAGQVLGSGNTLTVTQAGTYILTITASAGGQFCIKNDTIVITGNTTPPTVSTSGGVLGCGAAQAQLNTTTNAATPVYAWSPAQGLSATNIANPVATAPGTYTVVVTDNATGCSNSATVTVSGNTTPPSAAAAGGTLTCATTSIPINASSNVPNATFAWSGPPPFSSNQQNPNVSVSGTYTVTVTNPTNNCTATATTTVSLNNTAPAASATGGVISCTTPNVTLNGNSPTGGVSYAWTGPSGYTSSFQNPVADTAGVYTVVVTNPTNGCTSTATTSVTGNTNPPTAAATGGIVSCGTQNILINGSSTTTGATFAWAGPNGFTANIPNPSVNTPGVYTLTVTGTNSCTLTATATVDGDFDVPNASATGGVITCTASSTTITGSSSTPGVVFNWTGPSGNPYSGPTPTVSNIGVYTLTVTDPTNGCTTTATASVAPDANVPNVSAAGGTLDCNISTITLDGGSTTAGVMLSWTGPNNFTSTLEDPVITVSGTYTLTVVDPANGCTAVATAIVVLDDDEPGATATAGTVTCATPSLPLAGSSATNNVTWAWTGPNTFVSNLQNPTVMDAGDYFLVVTGTNGCTSSAMATVLADQTPPVPASTTGTLTCALTSLALNGSANVPVTYSWAGPNNFTSTDQSPSVTLPGDYTLTATADNGCTAATTVTVGEDIAAPDVTAGGNTITCSAPQVPLSGGSITPGAIFAWLGPNNFSSADPNPVVDANGGYLLTVTGPNGCTATATADVLLDTEAPQVIAQSTGVLTCSATTITVATTATNATSPIQSYLWNDGSIVEDLSVLAPGTYTVTVTSDNGCSTTASAAVTQDIVPPAVSAQGGTLTCLITSISLNGGSITPGATFLWQGPGGYSSALEDPSIDVEGTYTLTVTGPNGCTSTESATVVLDGDFPDAVAQSSNDLDCSLINTTLQANSGTPGVTYSWTDTSGTIVGNSQTITIDLPGVYQVAVTAPNGCVTNANVAVLQDITLPGATATGDTIDCISGQTSLIGAAQAAGVTWKWSGPNQFTSNQQNPVVSVAGTYNLTVTGTNGCTSTATAFVEENKDSPEVTVAGTGTLTCDVTSLPLSGTINTAGATGVWTSPAGAVISTNDTVTVSAPGVYTYTVTALNGCISAPTITIAENVQTPQNVVVNGGLINCKTPTLSLKASTSTPNVTFVWSGPGGFTSTEQNPQTDTSGTYTVLLTNQANGCEATAVTFVTEDFVQPDITVVTETITCTKPAVVLNSTTVTSSVVYNWAGPDITATNQKKADPSITKPGTYTVTITNQINGCTSTFSIDVDADVTAPDISTTGVTLTCTTPTNTITGSSQTPGVTFAWTGPGGFVSNQPSPTVTLTGDYTLTVTAPNGCTSTSVAAVVPDASLPQVTATGGLLTCAITSIQLQATANNPSVTWQWSGPGGFTSTTQNPDITVAGNYTVVVTAPNGCTASTAVQVAADTNGPSVVTSVPDELNCTTTQVSLSANVAAPGSYTYQWTTQTGNIISGAFSQSPVVSSAAVYTILVTNLGNGCTSTKDVPVVVDSTTVAGAVLAVRDVSCFGKTDGVVGVSSVIGGTPTFLYSLDNLPFVSGSTFTSLPPGAHSLVIQDANGCEWETSITIGEPEELLVELGPNVTIHLGQSIQLDLNNTVNYPDRVVQTIFDPSSMDSVFCPTCTGVLYPTNSFRYFMTVVDSNGCKATDNRTIIVDKTRWVYIPNSFDPNSTGDNNLLYIFGGEDVVQIKSFRVFDRWGNAVHEYFDFLPNTPSSGWDGSVRGDKANPGVYVYYAEILFKDGETILYKGDVTLFRNN